MFNAKDEEIRELLAENSDLWIENANVKMKIFKAIEYIKERYWDNLDDDEGTAFCDKLLEILGDKE